MYEWDAYVCGVDATNRRSNGGGRVKLALLGMAAFCVIAAEREVAITIDDLPRGGDSGCEAGPLLAMTAKLMKPFRDGHIPVTGFVIGSRCPDAVSYTHLTLPTNREV